MTTEFITPMSKAILVNHLEQGKKEAINIVLNEFDRLESIIKSYELAMSHISTKLEDRYVKNVDTQMKAIESLCKI